MFFNSLCKTFFASLFICVFVVVAQANTYVVTVTADSGPGSLRQAIIDSNLNPPPSVHENVILFDIPGHGVKTITLQSPLPGILYSLVIDGSPRPVMACRR